MLEPSKTTRAMPYEIKRLPFDGAVDADGHVCEPANLWEDYLEARYRPRAIRVKRDKDGWEYVEADGRVVPLTDHGIVSTFHGMGRGPVPSLDRSYMGTAPFGVMDSHERVELMNLENLDAAIVYPTIGLFWEWVTLDPEITMAYLRAYNRWLVDFCKPGKGRLVPVAHLTLLDVEASVKEMERAVRDGCKGAFVTLGAPTRKPHAHPDHDPLFAKAQELDIPLAIHVSLDPGKYHLARYDLDTWSDEVYFYSLCTENAAMQEALVGFFHYGTFEKFPWLRLGVLEAGSSWIGSVLDKLDAVKETHFGRNVPLKEKPSHYFKRQCFISGDPDEHSTAAMLKYVGPQCFTWASDFPHADHTASWVPELIEFAELIDPESRKLVLGDNIKRIYKLS